MELIFKEAPSLRELMRSLKLTREEAAKVQEELAERQKVIRDVGGPKLFNPLLQATADMLDSLERTRIVNENRMRTLWKQNPELDTRNLTQSVDELFRLENQAIRNLEQVMREHPLRPWIERTKGLGLKQVGRLVASVGDPYWHPVQDRPRRVSELWAFAGLHTDRFGSSVQNPGKANWSTVTKVRAWNIAVSCVKHFSSPYRGVYDRRREQTSDRVHARPCVPCGRGDTVAVEGSPWSKSHQHADALRIVSKEVLRDLWAESRRLYQELS